MTVGILEARPGRLGRDELVELYAAQRLGLMRLAVLLVDDMGAAEDVVHDAFTRFLEKAPALRDQSAAQAYLRASVVNGSRSALRRRRTARAYVAPRAGAPEGPESLTELREDHREVLEALAQLPQRQREVVVLRYWSDLSEADISTALGISRGTVKSTASRALATLEKILEGSR